MHVLRHSWQLIFRQRKDRGDGLKFRDDKHGIGITRVHHVSGIDQPQSDTSADRCCDVAIRQVQFRTFHGRLIVAHRTLKLIDRRLLSVDLLL